MKSVKLSGMNGSSTKQNRGRAARCPAKGLLNLDSPSARQIVDALCLLHLFLPQIRKPIDLAVPIHSFLVMREINQRPSELDRIKFFVWLLADQSGEFLSDYLPDCVEVILGHVVPLSLITTVIIIFDKKIAHGNVEFRRYFHEHLCIGLLLQSRPIKDFLSACAYFTGEL